MISEFDILREGVVTVSQAPTYQYTAESELFYSKKLFTFSKSIEKIIKADQLGACHNKVMRSPGAKAG